MSNIEQNLQKILTSRYGKDVRQSIHDSIHDCYEDGKAGAIDMVARERINNLVANNNPTDGNSELLDIRVGADGKTYPNAGAAVREQVSSLKEDKIDKPSASDDGKIPRAMGGEVEWVEVGQPTDDQTNNAVEKWLNEHPEATTTVQDGSIEEVKFSDTLRNRKASYYNFVSEMKADNSLKGGMVAVTLGYHELNDGGGATYRIRAKLETDIDDGGSIHELNGGQLVAEIIIEEYVTPEIFGAVGDGVHDDTEAFYKALQSNKKIICNGNKTYYFYSPIDLRDKGRLDEIIEIDFRGAKVVNLHIYFNLNDTLDDWRYKYSKGMLIIKNVVFGLDYYTIPTGWETPIITTGGYVTLENFISLGYPYIIALVNEYMDNLNIKNGIFSISQELYNQYGSLDLDGISIKDSSGYHRISRNFSNLSGDSWFIEQVHEFSFGEFFSSYNFLTIHGNHPITIKNCIQSNFSTDDLCEVIFIGCHWEAKSHVNINSDYGSHFTFLNCYFFNNIKIYNLMGAVYINCYWRTTFDYASSDLFNFTELCGDYLDNLKCTLINCSLGSPHVVNTNDYKNVKLHNKRTYYPYANNNRPSMDDFVPVKNEDFFGLFKELGTYKYKIYLMTTSANLIANESCDKSVEVTGKKNRIQILNLKKYFGGGMWFRVYRTDPTGSIQEAILRTPTIPFGEESLKGPLYESFNVLLADYGDYLHLTSSLYKDTKMSPISPWLPVDSIPDINVNKNIYECNGVIVTLDNSSVDLSGTGMLQIQI